MSDQQKPVRCQTHYVLAHLYVVVLAGCLAASPAPEHFTFKRWMQAAFWPVYITYVEVAAYFERIDSRARNIPVYRDSGRPLIEKRK